MNDQQPERRILLFQREGIRVVIHNNEWWLVAEDVVVEAPGRVGGAPA